MTKSNGVKLAHMKSNGVKLAHMELYYATSQSSEVRNELQTRIPPERRIGIARNFTDMFTKS